MLKERDTEHFAPAQFGKFWSRGVLSVRFFASFMYYIAAHGVLFMSGASSAYAQDPYAGCSSIDVHIARCLDRPSSYAPVDAYLTNRIAEYTATFGPDHGYTKKCIWSGNKKVHGFLQYHLWGCPDTEVQFWRYWMGDDCPLGTAWQDSSHACISLLTVDPAKNNQCQALKVGGTSQRPKASL